MGAVVLESPASTIPLRQLTFPGVGSMNGNTAQVTFRLHLSTTYATNGDTVDFTQATVGAGAPSFTAIQNVDINPELPDGKYYGYDFTNHKIKAYAAGGSEVGNGTDLSAIWLRVTITMSTKG